MVLEPPAPLAAGAAGALASLKVLVGSPDVGWMVSGSLLTFIHVPHDSPSTADIQSVSWIAAWCSLHLAGEWV